MNEKTITNSNDFLTLARENHERKNFDLAVAYAAAALNFKNEEKSDEEILETYTFMYQVFAEKGDKDKASQYLSTAMSLAPSNKDLAFIWFTNFAEIILAEIDCEKHIIKEPVSSVTSKLAEANESGDVFVDWFVSGKDPQNPSDLFEITFAVKMATDNNMNFIEFPGEVTAFLVSRKLCEKIGIPPTDLFIKDKAVERRQFIKMQ